MGLSREMTQCLLGAHSLLFCVCLLLILGHATALPTTASQVRHSSQNTNHHIIQHPIKDITNQMPLFRINISKIISNIFFPADRHDVSPPSLLVLHHFSLLFARSPADKCPPKRRGGARGRALFRICL